VFLHSALIQQSGELNETRIEPTASLSDSISQPSLVESLVKVKKTAWQRLGNILKVTKKVVTDHRKQAGSHYKMALICSTMATTCALVTSMKDNPGYWDVPSKQKRFPR
jgi:hypothetical protein